MTTKIGIKGVGKPAPRWYRITDKIWTGFELTILGAIVLKFPQTAEICFWIKMGFSFVKKVLDSILYNGEEFAPAGTTQELANETGRAIETSTETVLPEKQ